MTDTGGTQSSDFSDPGGNRVKETARLAPLSIVIANVYACIICK